MSRPRLLILDDGVAWRRAFSRALEREDAIEVIGTAELGEVGSEKFRQLQPDCVLLGISTPPAEARALRLLEEFRKTRPTMPVVVVSPLAERGSPMSLEFLSRGASAFASLAGMTPETEAERLGDELRKAALARIKFPEVKKPDFRNTYDPPTSVIRSRRGIEAVVVGVSTGGPNVLEQILAGMPRDFAVPLMIVQHILPTFTQSLVARLDAACPLPVKEAREGDIPSGGAVWLAPNHHHLEVVRHGDSVRLHLNDGPPENMCRPAADVLFRSAARTYGPNLLAIVLTGMGADGLRGCREIRKAGGTVIVQDEATSVVWGMPGKVAEEGLAHDILPASKIAPEITRLVGKSSPHGDTPSRIEESRA